MSDNVANNTLLRLTTEIVSAHVRHNTVDGNDLATLIRAVHGSLANAHVPPAEIHPPRPPAVPVKQSVFKDFIVCLEDGKKLRTLKRHLWSSFKLTPAQYRTKWGLPPDYPMVAPAYAAARSALAKSFGLGRKPAAPPPEAPPPRRGRRPRP